MVPESISAFDEVALTEYFNRAIPRPRWRPWLASLEDLHVGIKGVKIGGLRKVFRKATEPGRYGLAAWKWLRPNRPCPGLDELPAIQAFAGLEHVHAQTFALRLMNRCREIVREHPQLERWVLLRIAALEYVVHPVSAPIPDELRDSSIMLRASLFQAQHLCWQAPKDAGLLARRILSRAMEGAARAAVQAFGAGEGTLSSNLMVPMKGPTIFAPTDVARANHERAEELWRGLDFERRLVIVGETRRAMHLGFWVPLVRGDRDALLPGAPTAFDHGEGAAVFKDDLPALVGFPAAVEARWRSFMTERFRDRLFVALPFRAPDGTGAHVTPAVLNVNVSASDIGPWRRAYHPEWLRFARDRVQPFVEIAFGALMVILAQETQEIPALATGSDPWDSLPAVVPRLTAGRNDEQ